MRLVIVYFGPFTVNSAIQAFHFGNDLTELGWTVTLAGVGDPRDDPQGRRAELRVRHPSRPARGLAERPRRRRSRSIVLAWTPRENVRRATDAVHRAARPPLRRPSRGQRGVPATRRRSGCSVAELRRLTERRAASACCRRPEPDPPERTTGSSSPGAAGVTMITEELNEFNFADRPHHVARPGIDPERFRPDLRAAAISRQSLGIAPDEFVIVYHGTVHYANQHEMLSLYLAVKLLQRRGRTVRLVRLGETELGGVDPASFGAPARRRDRARRGRVARDPRLPGARRRLRAARRRRRLQPLPAAVEAARVPRHGAAGGAARDCNIGDDLEDGARTRCCSSAATRCEIATRVERADRRPGARATGSRSAARALRPRSS